MASPSVLIVEGKDELHVLYQLLEHHQVPETFRIKEKQGIENLLGTLDTEIDAGGLERLGVIVDADASPNDRWKSLRAIFGNAGCLLPERADPTGTVVTLSGRTLGRVGVWVMPDNVAAGMLEDFMRQLVPPGDALMTFAEECVDEVIALDRRFSPEHRSKALIHTWLSWQKEPGTPLGLAIKNREFDAFSPVVPPLINWLNQMFGVEEA